MREKIEKNFWDMEIIGNRRKKKFALKLQLSRGISNFDKRCSDAHFVSFLNYYYYNKGDLQFIFSNYLTK